MKKKGGEGDFPWLKKTGKSCARLCYHKPPKPIDFILAFASSFLPMEQKSPREFQVVEETTRREVRVRGGMQTGPTLAFHNVCSLLITKICVKEAEN